MKGVDQTCLPQASRIQDRTAVLIFIHNRPALGPCFLPAHCAILILGFKNLSDLYDKYVAEYQQTIAANKKEELSANVHYLDMTDVAPDSILQTFLDKYKGKTILIDIWATWCGPCKFGHEKMKPLKEELSGKDIVYIYLTSPTSDYDKWKEYITDISGEHYFLTEEQLDAIFKQLEGTGYPTYAIYTLDGEKTFTLSGFNLEILTEELKKALNE